MDICLYDAHVMGLSAIGAVAVPSVLSDVELAALNGEARGFHFQSREYRMATGVIQNLETADELPIGSRFLDLAHKTGCALDDFFSLKKVADTPIEFNDFSVQRYPVSKAGESYAISPHLDHGRYINVVAVYILRGFAPFYICGDRSGAIQMEIFTKSGDLILMRGAGFMGIMQRPFHYVGPVTEDRLTFGLRQTASATR